MLDEILPKIRKGRIPKKPQDLSKGSYFGGRRPEDGKISWVMSSQEIYNLIRGVTRPYPGAFGMLGDHQVIIWWARSSEEEGLSPGLIETSQDQVG
jgi:methionyl-tRNA formyltransferase